MTLRHLSIFTAVADTLSMTVAARQLFIAQPTVSQSIAELERDLGTKLFERIGGKLHLTGDGENFAAYARHVTSLIDEATKKIAKGGRLRVASTLTVATTIFNDILRSFIDAHPDCELTFRCENTATVERMLLSNEIDLALVEGQIVSPLIVQHEVLDDELVLIVPPDHPFAKKRSIAMHELSSLPFILREQGSGTRDIFDQTMALHEIPFTVRGILNNAEAIKLAVAEGLGASVISKLAIKRELARGELKAVKIQDLSFLRKFRVVYHRNKYLTEDMKDFAALCENR